MKTNYSAETIEQWLAGLVARGWTVSDADGIQTYSSPVTALGGWVTIIQCGRKLRTVTSYGKTYSGLVDAQIAVQTSRL